MVTVSAPGKIHLMGEHAVVYGRPALLAAVNVRLQVSIKPAKEKITIHLDHKEAHEFVDYALKTVQKELRIDAFPHCDVSVVSDIPFGYHLGSSAALAVATVGAAMYFSKKLWNPQEINRIAYEVEKKQHGNPSGGDNTAVTYGGFLWYRRELEFLKSMWQIPLTLPRSLNNFILINTGKPEETTGEMVSFVKSQVDLDDKRFERIFTKNEAMTRQVANAIKQEDEKMLTDAIFQGEKTLEAMGVVSQHVLACIRMIENKGGVAKILGGGGKKNAVGFMLVYSKERKQIEDIASTHGFTVQSVELGGDGVRLEAK